MAVIFPKPPVLDLRSGHERSFPKRRKPPPPNQRVRVVRGGMEPLTVKEMREWIAGQIPYRNLATDPAVADRAKQYCQQQARFYFDRVWQIRDKWRAIDYMLQGTTLSQRFPDSDIHVPEFYKMVETLVPRVEEAVFNLGTGTEWFHVRGRDRMDRQKAWRLQAWMRYLMEKGQFEDFIQEAARCLIVYGFFAIKSWWEIDYRDIIRRVVEERERNDGTTELRLQPIVSNEPFYEGPRFKLVDPYDFMIDTRRPDPQRSSFVGDISEMSWEEIEAGAKLGLYVNHEKLLEEEPREFDGTERKWSKIVRSLDSPEHIFTTRRAKGEPQRYEVMEFWCKWDPYGEGNAREYVITMANQTTVLRVQENFHDDKHRPYAVARAARQMFEFFNVAPGDHAVRLNIEMDEHRNLAMKGAQNAMCPLVFADHDDTDLPPNIFDVEPGTVFRTAREPTFFQSPANVANILQITESINRRDMEEVFGAPRIYEGTNPSSDTATGIMRKIEESNRRLRSLVRSFSKGLTQLLEHTWSLSAQFTTRRMTFPVLGKLAVSGKLGPHTEIGPEDLGDPVDFSLLGLHNIHSLGLRATNMATFLNQTFPIATQMVPPGSIDWLRLLQIQWDQMVGTVPGEEIFSVEQRPDDMMDPHEENLLIAAGHEVPVHDMDNDALHARVHQQWLEGPGQRASDTIFRTMQDHIAMHETAGQRKLLRQAAMAEMQERMMPPDTGQRPLGGKGRSGRSPDLGGPFTPAAVAGQTPGPMRAESIPAADRDRPYPQTENQGY